MKRPKRVNKLIAVDMDGVLALGECYTEEECLRAKPNEKIIQKVRELWMKGHIIIINTARRDELIPATYIWLKRHRVIFHGINNMKMAADLYIDDKSVRPEEL